MCLVNIFLNFFVNILELALQSLHVNGLKQILNIYCKVKTSLFAIFYVIFLNARKYNIFSKFHQFNEETHCMFDTGTLMRSKLIGPLCYKCDWKNTSKLILKCN